MSFSIRAVCQSNCPVDRERFFLLLYVMVVVENCKMNTSKDYTKNVKILHDYE